MARLFHTYAFVPAVRTFAQQDIPLPVQQTDVGAPQVPGIARVDAVAAKPR